MATLDNLIRISASADEAKSLAKAISEMSQADACFSPADLDSKDMTIAMNLYELLRLHNTCGSLMHMLIERLESLCGELDALCNDTDCSGKSAQKPVKSGK